MNITTLCTAVRKGRLLSDRSGCFLSGRDVQCSPPGEGFRRRRVNAVAWFIGQSIVIIAAAFLLGILVGWLIWGRTWRPKRSSVSDTEARTQAQTPLAMAAATSTAVDPEPEAVEPEPETVAELVESVDEAKPEAAEPETEAGSPLEPVAAQPVAAVATLESEVPDNLERIEGIGPKMAGALHEAGIRTYSQLANADEATLRRAIESHGMRFAPSLLTWGRQAQLLADGDEEGFADLTRRLVAGRDEGRQ